MKLTLMTPERTLLRGEATSVRGRAPHGEFEIRPNHGAWVSEVAACALEVQLAGAEAAEARSFDVHAASGRVPRSRADAEAGQTRLFAVHGGLIEVHPGSVLILADVAEAAADIDDSRAARARARAEEWLNRARTARGGEARAVDTDRARRALGRAMARLEAGAGGQ